MQPVVATAESPVGGAIRPSVLSPSPAEHPKLGVTQTLPGPGTLSHSQARPLVVSAPAAWAPHTGPGPAAAW